MSCTCACAPLTQVELAAIAFVGLGILCALLCVEKSEARMLSGLRALISGEVDHVH